MDSFPTIVLNPGKEYLFDGGPTAEQLAESENRGRMVSIRLALGDEAPRFLDRQEIIFTASVPTEPGEGLRGNIRRFTGILMIPSLTAGVVTPVPTAVHGLYDIPLANGHLSIGAASFTFTVDW
jgi:hypothetical protein